MQSEWVNSLKCTQLVKESFQISVKWKIAQKRVSNFKSFPAANFNYLNYVRFDVRSI